MDNPTDFRFRRENRLKNRREIRAVFKQGKAVSCFGAKLFVLGNALGYNRVAFTFSRKFGNAVQRNRCRRLGREAFRRLQHDIRQGFDLVLLVYPALNSASADVASPAADDVFRRLKQMRLLFSRAALL